jgi:hypothetical protein
MVTGLPSPWSIMAEIGCVSMNYQLKREMHYKDGSKDFQK